MGARVDLRADLYSCGCMLFEMLQGIPPFNGENYILLLNKHLVVEPPHLSVEIPGAEEIDAVIQKLLNKRPEDRFCSAKEVRAALMDIAARHYPECNLKMSQPGGPGLSPADSGLGAANPDEPFRKSHGCDHSDVAQTR